MAKKTENSDKKDLSKTEDEKLDDALDETFPASDPPSMTEPHSHVGGIKDKPAGTNAPRGR